MGRPVRLQFPMGIYHVTSRGNAKETIYFDGTDRRAFLGYLAGAVAETGWLCLAYCLMRNHFHLLVQTPEPNLSVGMHRLCGGYAKWFNRRRGRVGHLFQSRFHAEVIERDGHLLEACRYVVLNPVRAGICDDPCAWCWSSFAATAGLAEKPDFLTLDVLLGLFHSDRRTAHARYRDFVLEAAA